MHGQRITFTWLWHSSQRPWKYWQKSLVWYYIFQKKLFNLPLFGIFVFSQYHFHFCLLTTEKVPQGKFKRAKAYASVSLSLWWCSKISISFPRSFLSVNINLQVWFWFSLILNISLQTIDRLAFFSSCRPIVNARWRWHGIFVRIA